MRRLGSVLSRRSNNKRRGAESGRRDTRGTFRMVWQETPVPVRQVARRGRKMQFRLSSPVSNLEFCSTLWCATNSVAASRAFVREASSHLRAFVDRQALCVLVSEIEQLALLSSILS